MAKTKKAAQPSKDVKSEDKALSAVKEGGVLKPAQTPKSKSKELAKQTATKTEKVDKKSKKSKKEPTPEPSSESDSEGESDDAASIASSASSDSDAESESEAEPKANGFKTNGVHKPAAVEADTSDSSESSGDEDEAMDEEPALPKSAPDAKGRHAVAGKGESSSEEDSDEDSEDESEADNKPAQKAKSGTVDSSALNGKLEKIAPAQASSEEDSDSEGSSGADSGSGSGSDDDSSEDESEEEAAPPKKRKAETKPEPPVKKSKFEKIFDDGKKKNNLFVGSLSWNIDEEWLTREFEQYGEISNVKIIMDRDSGRSKGFGYVQFVDSESGIKAHKEMNGALLDNRNIKVDFAEAKTTTNNNRDNRSGQYGDKLSPPSDTIFVANLAFSATQDVIRDSFESFGSLLGVRLPTHADSGQPKGIAYVQFGSVEDATEAQKTMNGASIAGRPVRTDFASARPPRDDSAPRGGMRGGRGGGMRGGGGRGGDRGGRGGRGGSTNRGGFGDFQGKKMTF